MHNVWTVALRPASSCLRSSIWTAEKSCLRNAFSVLANSHKTAQHLLPKRATDQIPLDRRKNIAIAARSIQSSTRREFRTSSILQKLKPNKPGNVEQGLAFRSQDLTQRELARIFGSQVPPLEFANRLLRILHARRVDGTLDIDPPEEVTRQLQKYPYAAADALKWLRVAYPIDEDAAIIQRLEREESNIEQDSPAQLMARAEKLGLYKPQSGTYGAKLGEEGDIFGESELDKIRAANIAEAEREQEELDKQIQQLQEEAKEKSGTLQIRDENALEAATEQRPPNTYEKWVLQQRNKAQSTLTLESPEIAGLSLTRRILPSFLFVTIATGLCYLYSQYWVPPARADRVWPNTSLSWATILGIASLNVFVFALWRAFPPAWRLLNRYFVNVTATPRPLAMLGSMFSHQGLFHLAANMGFLILIPIAATLHEEVGRGTFLAIYLASGLFASFAPFAFWAARGQLTMTSLGASGAVFGILAAYCTIHTHHNFSIWFIPASWQEKVQLEGWVLLIVIATMEVVGLLSPVKVTIGKAGIDHLGHLGGFCTGVVSGWWWKTNRAAEGSQKEKEMTWYEKILGRRPTS